MLTQRLSAQIFKPTTDWFANREKWFKKNEWPLMKAAGKTDAQVAEAYWSGRVSKEFVKEFGDCPRRNKHHGLDPKPLAMFHGAIAGAMRDLLRPVLVRDVAVNILGTTDDYDNEVEPSQFAGIGVPHDAMVKKLRKATP